MHENPTTDLIEQNKPSTIADQVTVVIPTYNRRDFLDSLDKGRWDTLRVLLICDGCNPSIVHEFMEETRDYDNITVVDKRPNRGVAYAKSAGIQQVNTPYFMFCDDDDYYVDYHLFLDEVDRIREKDRHNILFATTPEMVILNEGGKDISYDRRIFHGKTGREVLKYIVHTGEIQGLCAGSLFRKNDVLPHLPEPFFRVSEDAMLLIRLCAHYPERTVYVSKRGRYMRRMHSQSLSSRHNYPLEKALMHIVSLVVAGYYATQLQIIPQATFIRLLLNRGKILQKIYGYGLKMTAFIGGLLLARSPEPRTEEAARALNFLKTHREMLPPEFNAMLSEAGQSMLAAA